MRELQLFLYLYEAADKKETVIIIVNNKERREHKCGNYP